MMTIFLLIMSMIHPFPRPPVVAHKAPTGMHLAPIK